MSSKTTQLAVGVNDQRRLAIRLESAAMILADKSQETLHATLPPIFGDGVPPPDLAQLGRATAHLLGWRRRRLDEAEAVYAHELRGVQRLRALRDDACRDLIASLRVVRARLEYTVGEGQSLSFAGFRTGLQYLPPDLLARIAEEAVAELRRIEPGSFRSKRGATDLASLVDIVVQPLANLQRALDELTAGLAATEAWLEEKNSELAALTRDNRRSAGLLAAGYRFAGLEFHAERLRGPKARRKSSEETPNADVVPEMPPVAANDLEPIRVAG
jgi:hypothetical protein